ncbi:RagB/SusD family nutrient uptake outer membrane protein [Mucilaginibacter sp. BJC16-A38]|uniref:RagB/SusD family nutrient uptake outer membrane protein n=1 Tax=Mucilaginibacter phenanthrenivorans TaxID=1234842 RepID=UPI002157489D|nr:RagB/SusD family nutrient uptake outer membrane protein [Mucilaginibacter phenanthrenivorans]MCR8556963.1 RagB/SusD family nutrient uptake outer membrane protein [Mucilaginibacter phenanthrenivorans]
MKRSTNYYMLLTCIFWLASAGCQKLVNVPEPTNTLTTTETFSTDANATSAIAAIYNDLTSGGSSHYIYYGNGLTTYLAGLSADEFTYSGSDPEIPQFQNNHLLSSNSESGGYFWLSAYFDIYMCNAAIEALDSSNTLTPSTKNQLLGEAKFLRAYVYFYLVNLFGDVPLTTTSAFATNALLKNTPAAQTYKQIISDLQDAQRLLASDYSYSGGERIRANKWAATALLARVYLYQGSLGNSTYYAKADSAASAVIGNSGTYTIASDLNAVFLANSPEAIWQLKPNASDNYATWEGFQLIYALDGGYPQYDLTSGLLNAFEPNDQRKVAWTYSVDYSGVTYYGPYKYKISPAANTSSSNIPEYYMMLRLSEQYLIRAEAGAQDGKLPDAIADLNVIRNRAGLPSLSSSLSQAQVLAAVMQERRIELFAEWGHRWFDLKRTGQATAVLSQEKGHTLSSNALLWPVPIGELTTDPNLKQNPGY